MTKIEFWQNEIHRFLKRYNKNELIIHHSPGKPFLKLEKKDNNFFLSYWGNNQWSQEERITEDTLNEEHEIASIILKGITQENNRYITRYNAYFKGGVSIALGILAGAITAGL